MIEEAPQSARAEWRRYGMVPIAAAIGYSTLAIQTYIIGPFVLPLESEFGWSRADIMVGLTIANFVGVLLVFAMGVLADKFGPRRVGLSGMVATTCAMALLGTATGTVTNWALLWTVAALAVVFAQANVWASGVASRFDKGRGTALAVTLSGSSFTAAVMPLLATWLIADYGWRLAFVGIAAIWLVVGFPIVFLFFRGKRDEPRPKVPSGEALVVLAGMTIRESLRTRTFWQLVIAAFAFAFYTMTIAPSLVPLMMSKGETAAAAAQIAALLGLVGFISRLSAGVLLDHFSANLLGAVVFLLPVIGCALLLAEAPGYAVLLVAVVSFGITIGAEYDVVFFMVSRQFGLRNFAAIMGALLTAGSLGGAGAPLIAGWMYDHFGGYDQVLVLLMALMAAGALAISTIGRPKQDWSAAS